MTIEEQRQKAHELVDAYLDHKDIVVKDVEGGVKHWTSIYDPRYWTFLQQFIDHVDNYKILE